jgi:hypothetical protein
MIARSCIAILLGAGLLLSAAGTAGALTCDGTPYKQCRGHTTYVCHKVKATSGGKSFCFGKCIKDLTGGFGPCP